MAIGTPISRKSAIQKLRTLGRRSEIKTLPLQQLFPYGIVSEGDRDPAWDRDIVLSMTALVEQGLEEAILAKLPLRDDCDAVLISGQSPLLRDMRSKAEMAYLLGVIGPETKSDLKCIREIRNAFAHMRGYLDLDHVDIQNVLHHISAHVRLGDFATGREGSDLRERFISTCVNLVMYLFGDTGDEDVGAVMDNRRAAFQQ